MAGERVRGSRGKPHALLAGGGSGGHVFPALAIGAELEGRGWRLSYAGSPTGMEARLVQGRGMAFVPLAARPFVGQSAWGKTRALLTLVGSTLGASSAIGKRGIDVVIGTGGYVSAAAVLGGWLRRRPRLLVEPNARAGRANRFLSRFASAAALGWETATEDVGCVSFVAGVPVRLEFFSVPPLESAPPPRVLVLGGSQGSRKLNEIAPRAVAIAKRDGMTVIHQCGEGNVEAVKKAWEAAGVTAGVEVVPFLPDVAGALARSTIVVSRAGAITLAELCAAGRPSILVPLVLAGGHQMANARALEQGGATLVLPETSAGAAALAGKLTDLFATPTQLLSMGRAARALARPGAASAIADCVEGLLTRRKR